MPVRERLVRLATVPTALGAVALVVALSACSPDQGPTSPPPSSSTSTPGSTVSTPDASDVRGRLAAGLQGSSPVSAKLVGDPKTTLTPVEAAWLPGWQVFDIQNQTPPHPRRLFAALADSGEVLLLTGQPAAFSSMLQRAGVAVDSAEVAQDVAALFLDATRTFATYSYRIDGVDDITWRPTLTAEQQATKDALITAHGQQIKPPTAEKSSSGWTVSLWTVTGTDLVRHEVSIGSDGTVTDKTETVASDLPVPASN